MLFTQFYSIYPLPVRLKKLGPNEKHSHSMSIANLARRLRLYRNCDFPKRIIRIIRRRLLSILTLITPNPTVTFTDHLIF